MEFPTDFSFPQHFAANSLSWMLTAIQITVILTAGYLLSRWISHRFVSYLSRLPHSDTTLIVFLATVVRYTLMALTVVICLGKAGVQTASIITVLGAAGLAVGLALQSTLANIASGIMILMLRPFRIGEYIEAGETKGTIESIGLFSTQLKDAEGLFIMAPNSGLFNRTIKNFSRNPLRRVMIPVGIAYRDSISMAKELILAELRKEETVAKDPAPQVLVDLLDRSSVNLQIRFWVNRQDYLGTKSKMTQHLREVLDQGNIGIPFPQSEITLISKSEA